MFPKFFPIDWGVFPGLPTRTLLNKRALYRDAKENLQKSRWHKVLLRNPAGSHDRITDPTSIRTLPRFVLQTHTLRFRLRRMVRSYYLRPITYSKSIKPWSLDFHHRDTEVSEKNYTLEGFWSLVNSMSLW